MPIPAGYVRYVLVGHLGASEIFETGFWAQADIPDEATANDSAATEAANVATDFGPMFDIITADSGYDEVRVYCYPTGGPSAAFIGSAPITGGAGGSAVMNADQLALVCTLETGFSGRRNRGRMYLPGNGLNGFNGDHQVPASTCSDIAEAMATHLGRLEGNAVVLSQVAGSAKPITSVRVDSRADVQRRRANRQAVVTHSTAVLP